MLKTYIAMQSRLMSLKDRLAKDESGAALIEYSVLIGLITVAAIASVTTVGAWVATQWGNLVAALPAAAA